MSKIQFLKANHNAYEAMKEFYAVVYQCQRYNFWKQITTDFCCLCRYNWLFINVKDTIFESKSQLMYALNSSPYSCLSMSKIQFLKANHNINFVVKHFFKLFINVKDTIFESKSQQHHGQFPMLHSCLSMSKIQFLKANHNSVAAPPKFCAVVYQCQRYNFWKQITTDFWRHVFLTLLFINVKDTIFESKSQHWQEVHSIF